MVKKYRVKVNGKEYLVEVEEVEEKSEKSKVIQTKIEETKTAEIVSKQSDTQPNPSSLHKSESKGSTTGKKVLKSPMAGVVVKILVSEGQKINVGDPVLIFEAMKMENELRSDFPGTVAKVLVKEGDTIETGQELIVLK
ncbi:MAG: acetyl-CoA carboxylase biotin carboxyl carrier protein subunit [Thermotogaceae bacterium]|nr:acetyl-CoA carboxylase biotin carboxyl carrier protein subunit [Thermotogaceae bacterium]